MELLHGTLRPGKIINVLENGEVKCTAPGLFNIDDEDKNGDKLPPIYPFFNIFSSHSNSYSEPKKDDDVWVLNLSDNPRQLYWFRRDDFKSNNSELIKGTNVEIICNRAVDGGYASIYFKDGHGWVINNKGALINISTAGDISLIPSDGGCIILGDNSHSVARFEETKDVITQIWTSLLDLSTNLNLGSIMNGIATTLLMADILQIPSMVDKIKSPNTYTR